jgi:hypothetical protein
VGARIGSPIGKQKQQAACREELQALGMLHVLRGASAMNYFHDKFGVLHRLLCCLKVDSDWTPPFRREKRLVNNQRSFLYKRVTFIAAKNLPHSKQCAFNRDVINPQDGHILCDPNPATCGFRLRIRR